MQVYAPVDEVPAAFHRTIYVFISPDGRQLAHPGGARALRCQLPRRNAFYADQPAGEAALWPPPLPPDHHAAALAQDPWRAANHETASLPAGSAGSEMAEPAMPALLPEAELVVEPEPGASAEDDAAAAAALRQYKQRTAEEGEYDEDELPPDLVDSLEGGPTPEQRHFAEFAARVGKDPQQVLRYCFDPGAAPLCPSPSGVPGAADVPRCGRCGAARRFEFQVMPQLLNHLGADASDPGAPDWGTIAVYCCSASCSRGHQGGEEADWEDGGSAYVEEFVWVQPSA